MFSINEQCAVKAPASSTPASRNIQGDGCSRQKSRPEAATGRGTHPPPARTGSPFGKGARCPNRFFSQLHLATRERSGVSFHSFNGEDRECAWGHPRFFFRRHRPRGRRPDPPAWRAGEHSVKKRKVGTAGDTWELCGNTPGTGTDELFPALLVEEVFAYFVVTEKAQIEARTLVI